MKSKIGFIVGLLVLVVAISLITINRINQRTEIESIPNLAKRDSESVIFEAGYDSSNGSAQPEKFDTSKLSYNLKEYFPLNQENTWIYTLIEEGKSTEYTRRIDGKETVNEIETVKLFSSDDNYVGYAFNPHGLSEYINYRKGKGESKIYSPPMILFPFLEIGSNTSDFFKCENFNTNRTKKPDYSVACEISLEKEDVEVPAGKFSDCLKFIGIYRWLIPDVEGYWKTERMITWLAKNVGPVKFSCNIEGSDTETYPYSNEAVLIKMDLDN